MLLEVRIRNVAVIRTLEADFAEGLHVITGETGSGKSVLLHALALIAGARASRSMIREGADALYVEAVFSPPAGELLELVSAYGIGKDEPLVLSRTVHASGRSAARIQGQLVTVGELKAVGERLLDVYGQKDRALLDQEQQLGLLDSFLSPDAKKLRKEYRILFSKRRQLQDLLQQYGTDSSAREREMDILRYQIGEIEAFNPGEMDIESLEAEHRRLLHAEELLQYAEQVHSLIAGWSDEQPGAADLLARAEGLSHKMEGLDSSFVISERFTEITEALRDVHSEITRAAEGWQMDPGRLERLDQQMNDWMRLQRKYGNTKEEVLAFYQRSREEYDRILQRETELQNAEREIQTLTKQMQAMALELREHRRKIGRTLDEKIIDLLQDLRMPNVAFETRFYPVELNDNGGDQVVFYIRTNQGQAMQPLHEIASGGELSRVMLAIRSLFSEELRSETIIFDEIDTGVSGRAAQAMAEFLHRLSRKIQIIAVTHLPQIAAMGDAHSLIEKQTQEGETVSTVTGLDWDERTEEVVRLISGTMKTTSAAAQAEQLLKGAREWKQGGNYGL